MSKELFVSSTPHQTKVALVESDLLSEVYFERENEYTLAGSIYKGRVTRVLPGMQSAFVDIGLERDAFLYVSDFMELENADDDLDDVPAAPVVVERKHIEQASVVEAAEPAEPEEESFAEGASAEPSESRGNSDSAARNEGRGGWRGRRRRRGRGDRGDRSDRGDRGGNGHERPSRPVEPEVRAERE